MFAEGLVSWGILLQFLGRVFTNKNVKILINKMKIKNHHFLSARLHGSTYCKETCRTCAERDPTF